MAKIGYKQRIHKNKLSFRSLRYAAADQAVRWFPALGERWLFPTEAIPMAEAAASALSYDTLTILDAPPPAVARLVTRPVPFRSLQKVYTFDGATLVGQSGALIQNGKLLAVRPNPNWAVSLRPRRYDIRTLDSGELHYALTPPAPAIAHVFHWLFDYVTPLMTWLEQRQDKEPVRPIVNARLTEFQRRTLDYLTSRYALLPAVQVAPDEAAFAKRIAVSIVEPWTPRAIQVAAGITSLNGLGDFLSGGVDASVRRRIYISRNDAKLRRVANERELAAVLARYGFKPIVLKGKPIAEQVRLLREAEAVAAPHGAGLTHIAWMQRGAAVIEFFPSPHGPRGAPKNATADYWIVSQQKGLDYEAHEARPQTNRHDLFEIPPALLDAVLARRFRSA
jgi:hypothetical protein